MDMTIENKPQNYPIGTSPLTYVGFGHVFILAAASRSEGCPRQAAAQYLQRLPEPRAVSEWDLESQPEALSHLTSPQLKTGHRWFWHR
jgi:hypothetical protein